MTSASGWLKMSSVGKNLRNSEIREVWARMNKTLTYGVGFGSLESRRKEQKQCVRFPRWCCPLQPCSPLLHHFLHRKYNDDSIHPHPTLCPFPQTRTPYQKGACEFFQGGQPFISVFPASSTMLACRGHPRNVCWVSEWVDFGWSWGETGE